LPAFDRGIAGLRDCQPEQVGPIQFRAVNSPTGAEFRVAEVYGRFHQVTSNTGGEYLLYLGECSCPDTERARAEGRVCKHAAVVIAVEALLKNDTLRQDLRRKAAALREEAAQADVAATFAAAA
jgi:hypothetical protein